MFNFFNKKSSKSKDFLSEAKKVTVNVKKLLEHIGGIANICKIESTHTKIKIYIKKRSKVEIEKIKSQKNISGVLATTKCISIIVGNQAKHLSKLILNQ